MQYTVLLLLPLLLSFLVCYFIPRIVKSSNVEMYVRSGDDEDSETVNVLARPWSPI